jgi:hypothetical protein
MNDTNDLSLRWRVLLALARVADKVVEFFLDCRTLLRVHITRRWNRRSPLSLEQWERSLISWEDIKERDGIKIEIVPYHDPDD